MPSGKIDVHAHYIPEHIARRSSLRGEIDPTAPLPSSGLVLDLRHTTVDAQFGTGNEATVIGGQE
jgi:hypothetical protein